MAADSEATQARATQERVTFLEDQGERPRHFSTAVLFSVNTYGVLAVLRLNHVLASYQHRYARTAAEGVSRWQCLCATARARVCVCDDDLSLSVSLFLCV
jgi:hypothetical protein